MTIHISDDRTVVLAAFRIPLTLCGIPAAECNVTESVTLLPFKRATDQCPLCASVMEYKLRHAENLP